MSKKLWIVLLVFLGLFACWESAALASGAKSQDAQGSEKKAGISGQEADWLKKSRAHIRLSNRMTGFLVDRRARRSEMEAMLGNFKSVRSDDHYFCDVLINDLREAIAMPGTMVEVDAAARQVLSAIESYVPNWRALQEYNKAGLYKEDEGKKGREMLPMYVEGIDALRAAVGKFNDSVGVISRQSHKKVLARYKAEGRLLEMHTWEAIGAARNIIETFNDAEDFKDGARIDFADSQLALIEKSIERMKVEHARRKKYDRQSLPAVDRYDSVLSSLVDFADYYRSARQNPTRFRGSVSRFNRAVSDVNMMSSNL